MDNIIQNSSNQQLINSLNDLLANLHIHYQKARNFHWNVYGDQFFQLHETFETLYNDVKIQIDEVAERILSLHQKPVSNLSDYLEISDIKESYSTMSPEGMVTALQADFKILIPKMKNILTIAGDLEDQGTDDLISGFLQKTEKREWMFRSYLKQPVAV